MARRLQSADNLLGPAVQATINALTLTDEDTAAVKLAQRYAATIDEATITAAALEELPYDEGLFKRVAALAAKVEAQTVLDTLGPKLLACLESLGATPKARAALRKGDTGAPSKGKLAAMRAARRPA